MKQKDWREIHAQYIKRWERRKKQPLQDGPPHDPHAFNEYLWWLHRSICVQARQAYPGRELPTNSEDDIVADEYAEVTMLETQPQRAPLQRYVVRSWVRALWVGCIPVLVNCNIKVKPRLCM
jgi:hypothetical protein